MPQIKEYTSPVDRLQPTERGIDAKLQEARRTGAFFNQAGEAMVSGARAQADAAGDVARSVAGIAGSIETAAQQQETFAGHREVSKGAAEGAKLFSNLTTAWDNTVKKADPNDPSVAAKFREEVLEPSLQNFKETFSNTDRGIQWSEQHVESMRNHFFQKTAADMSTLAGKAVEVNVRQINNSNANAAFSSPDFHTVDYLLDKTVTDIGAVVDSSNIKGAESSKVRMELTEKARDQLVKAAAAGAIAKSSDPEKTAQDFADRYPEYLSGADTKAFARAAKTQAKANALADKQIETYERQQADRAVHAASAKLMNDYVSTDPVTGQIIIKPGYFRAALDIARQYPNAPSAAAQVHSQITWGEHQQNQKAAATVSDPVVKADLFSRMFDPNNPTTEIDLMKANVSGKLSTHDFSAMHGLQKALDETPLKGEVMKDTLAAVKANLTYSMPGMPGRDPKGLSNYSAFIQQFIPQYISQSRAGTLPANALDTRDPNSLISQTMAPFKRSARQLIDDRVQEMSTLADGNITGPNKTITGQETINQPPGAKTFVPPSNWQFSAGRNQYRDPQGQLYDVSGNKVK